MAPLNLSERETEVLSDEIWGCVEEQEYAGNDERAEMLESIGQKLVAFDSDG